MIRYFATVLPGLETVLSDEIKMKITDAHILESARGKVFFASACSLDRLMALRTADNLYRVIDRFEVGPHRIHLPALTERIARLDLSFAMNGLAGERCFRVNASRRGKQSYSRFEAAEAARAGIAKRYKDWRFGEADEPNVEFRLDIDDSEATFSLRLTDAAFRYRGADRQFAPAALRPPVAHAMVRLSDPEEADVFVDPCCGSGTIVAERLQYPYARIAGGDLSPEALKAALVNVKDRPNIDLREWDARRLPLDAGSVDKVAANLPFGVQIGRKEDIPELYRGLLKETGRILRKGGVAVMLTECPEELLASAEAASLLCVRTITVSLKGHRPTLFLLRRG
jgi:23S rRNA G2445 N2-methylase RlmL